MFYTIYKITNQIDGKFYIGSHKTKDLNDVYMGSGKYLKRAQEKFGIENFKKEILFVFETAEEMYAKEAEIVNEDFLATENTYNLMEGGKGGFEYINDAGKNGTALGVSTRKELSQTQWYNDWKIAQLDGCRSIPKEVANERAKRATETKRRLYGDDAFKTMSGKTHSAETRKKISQSSKKHSIGSGNSQYGTMWVWHEMFGNKKIKKDKLVEYLDQGWFKCYKPGFKVSIV